MLTFYLERIFAIFPSGSSLATRIKRLEGGVCWLATGQQPNTAILKGTTVPDNKLSQKSKYLSCDPERHRDRDSYSEQCRGPSFGPHGPPQKQNDPIFLSCVVTRNETLSGYRNYMALGGLRSHILALFCNFE